MNKKRIDQLVAGFSEGDAISRDAMRIKSMLEKMGYESRIFVPAGRIGQTVVSQCRPLEDYDGQSTDILIYHYSTASFATQLYIKSSAFKIVRYHNITPPEFFVGYDESLASELVKAREELKLVLDNADRVCAVSSFNAAELRKIKNTEIKVIPLFFTPAEMQSDVDPSIAKLYGGGFVNILFVGRIVPNKCIEELILAFAWYHKCLNSVSRLILAGSERSCPRYYAMLSMLAARLELQNVCFQGFVNDRQLYSLYRLSHLFVCASRHEGYCLPLLEAMTCGIPVVTREVGGMPEAMGGAGVMYDELNPRQSACLWHKIIVDENLRSQIIESQKIRIESLKGRNQENDCRYFTERS